jgi:hypothetical protein
MFIEIWARVGGVPRGTPPFFPAQTINILFLRNCERRKWLELESNQPFRDFKPTLIRLSYPAGMVVNKDCGLRNAGFVGLIESSRGESQSIAAFRFRQEDVPLLLVRLR